MKSRSRTAVITINYNSNSLTISCAKSLMSLSVPPPLLVIIDNGSSLPLEIQDLSFYPEVLLIRSDKNLGFAKGNNLGIRWVLSNTDCEFLFILNNDTIVDEYAIEILQNTMNTMGKQVGVISPRILLKDNPEKLWYGGGNISWLKGKGEIPGYLGPATSEVALTPRFVEFVSGCAMFARRQFFQQLGGFDERFFLYEEDLELCLRAREKGWLLYYEPRAVVFHEGQGSLKKSHGVFYRTYDPKNPNLAFIVYHRTRNRLLNMYLHASGAKAFLFWLFFPFWTFRDVGLFLIHGRKRPVRFLFRGILDFFRYLINQKQSFREESTHNTIISEA